MGCRIAKAWSKWRSLTGILCDKTVPKRLKGKVYRVMVRPVMMYGSETWATKVQDEKKLAAAEIRILRWTVGKTKLDKVRNEDVRKELRVADISKNVQGSRLRWLGHMERRPEKYVGKVVERVRLDGKRKRGRPRMTWRSRADMDMKELGIRKELAQDRDAWRTATTMADPRTSGTTSST